MNSKTAVDKIMKILGLTSHYMYEAKTEQGIAIKVDGDLELGAPIYVSTEEGMIPAPDGPHTLDDGTQIEVKDGKISKIDVSSQETEVEEPAEVEVEEEMSDADYEFADLHLVDGGIIRLEGAEPSVGLRVMKVNYDGTLTAIHDGQYETVDGKVIQIVGGSIEGVQSVADNAKRKTGFADYPWDKCMEDQMKQYGDEETAKKVCGAMKAGMSAEFATVKDKAGNLLSSPGFKIGDEVSIIQEDGSTVRAKDQGYEVEIGGKSHTVYVTDGMVSKVDPPMEAEGPEDVQIKASEMAAMFADAFKEIKEKLDILTSKQEQLEGKFQKFSAEPAGSKVYTQKTINENPRTSNERLEGFKRLREALSHN